MGSFWGRSWVPLGGHFRSSWRFFRSKRVPEPSSNSLVFEKVIVHETICFIRVWGVSGPKMVPPNDPRSLQDGSKIVLDRYFFLLIFRYDFRSFWVPFLVVLGCPNGPLEVTPRGANRRAHVRVSVCVCVCLGSVLLSSCRLGSFFGRFGVVLGSFLGAPGVVLVLFRRFNSSIQPVNSSTRRFNASTH